MTHADDLPPRPATTATSDSAAAPGAARSDSAAEPGAMASHSVTGPRAATSDSAAALGAVTSDPAAVPGAATSGSAAALGAAASDPRGGARPGDADWARRRAHAVAAHAADLARRESADEARAAGMLRDFVAAARSRGLAMVALSARTPSGGRRRTGLHGWYLGAHGRFAVDAEARFYLLSVPEGGWSRLAGARVSPARPRLVVGEGGGDGERVPLSDLLDRALAGA